MKADERVSDDRLEEVVQTMQRWCDDSGYTNLPYFIDESLSLHRELQSRRAAEQATLPAVEEMAKSIAWDFALYEGGVGENYEGLRQAVVSDMTPRIANFLSPLYAKLADLEQQLSRNQQFVADQGQAIAEYAEVLGECKRHVVNELIHERANNGNTAEYRELQNTIARIDALLGAKGEIG
jgi:hypothetical protein